MRLLILGGTVFLSRAAVEAALRRGHEVVAVARGTSGTVSDGATFVRFDRSSSAAADDEVERDGAALTAALSADGCDPAQVDAVIDVSSTPSQVRAAAAALPEAHWVFVSTINVYDEGDPDVVRPAEHRDVDPATGPDVYGAMKVACEEIVRGAVASASVVRPGLIVGPGDPSGRFTYWVARMRHVPERPDVLAPGRPDDPIQLIDVRDLADWLVDLAERRVKGTYDGVGPAASLGTVLDAVAAGCGVSPRWRWVDRDVLESRQVAYWSGERSLPLWLPHPEHTAMVSRDAGPSVRAGLEPRSVAETARDTSAWWRSTPDAAVTGLTLVEEAQVLGEQACCPTVS